MVAALAIGLVLTHRTSGLVNLAHAAMGMYVAFAFYEFRETGDLVLPVVALPARFHLLARPTLASALAVTIVLSLLVGVAVYGLVVRPLRQSPPLARVVASLGLLLYLQEVVRIQFPVAGAAVARRRPVLPEDPVRMLGTSVTQNRLLLAGLAILVALLLTLVFKVTRVGLATRAAADSEKGALLLGLSPDRLATGSWAVASFLAGMAVILLEPISGLNAATTPLLVVPAVAAALVGRLQSFVVTTFAGLAIGMVQSLILGYAVRPTTTWIPDWLPTTGLQQLVPVVLILAVLLWRGDALPTRATLVDRRLPPSPIPRHVTVWTVVLGGAALVLLLTGDASLRQGLIVTMVAALLALSIVVVTGYSGQISVAPLALAGVAGFTAVRMVDHGWPFLLATPVAVVGAVLLGTIVAYPATRVRGMGLAVATLAFAVAIEELVLASPSVSGGAGGAPVPRPDLFGLDIGVSARGADNFRPAYGAVVLVTLVLSAVAVANLRRNRTGLRWLAVRANERAAAAAGIDVTRAKLGGFAVGSVLAGLAGVLMVFSSTSISTSSFMVIGALVALAMTYLAGVSSVGGALVAGCLAQAGLLTSLSGSGSGDTAVERYRFAISGIALIVMAIAAPEGLTGLVRRGARRVRSGRAGPPSATAADAALPVSSTARGDAVEAVR